ncbi:MAG TPA: DNA primase [Pantanalinema sp.]
MSKDFPGGLDPVELVRDRADILEIIGESVVLKRSGRNYTGLCPFHGEKTPSFNVNPEKRIFRCFGCGEGGDVFAFVMKQQNLGFRDALKVLAERYGIAVAESDPMADERKLLRHANELAAAFYRRTLAEDPAGEDARAYLAQRGVNAELQERFGLGYAPREWDALHRHLTHQGVSAKVQEDAGLVRARREGNGFYDYFRGRVIFPITGDLGQVIAFGARAIHPGDEPKYLNSPDTPLYHKGRHLYALPIAKEGIKRKDRALLMEGYMDVIAAHRAGFTEAVGVLGTALTPPQAKSLLRYSKRVVVSYDADKAGQAATDRGIATLEEVAGSAMLDVRVLRIPQGKDPDEFLRSHGAEAFEELVEGATTLIQYQLDRAIEGAEGSLDTPEGKEAAVQACKKILGRVSSAVLRDEFYAQLAKRLDVSRDALSLEIGKEFRHNRAPRRSTGTPLAKRNGFRQAEADLLTLMVEHNTVRQDVSEHLAGIPFTDEDCQWLRETIEAWPADKELSWEALLTEYTGEQEQGFISRLAFGADSEKWHDVEQAATSIIHTIAISFWTQEHDTCKELLEAAIRESAPPDEINEVLRQYKHALTRKEDLKSRSGSVLPTHKMG